MSAHCCGHKPDPEARPRDAGYRRVLWIALGINAVMFVVEIVAGLAAGSVSLQADALDFLAGTRGTTESACSSPAWRCVIGRAPLC